MKNGVNSKTVDSRWSIWKIQRLRVRSSYDRYHVDNGESSRRVSVCGELNITWFKIMKQAFIKRQIRCVYRRISLIDHRQTWNLSRYRNGVRNGWKKSSDKCLCMHRMGLENRKDFRSIRELWNGKIRDPGRGEDLWPWDYKKCRWIFWNSLTD